MSDPQDTSPAPSQAMTLAEVGQLAGAIRGEVAKAVVGQTETIDHLLIALLAQGHVLLEGPPGTAKTFLAQCFAASLGLDFGRIQFTPDLLPGDILGSSLFNFQTSQFTLTRGPIFCDLLLADEINRTPPKTQASLLEAMQERRVTVQGKTYHLDPPFFVFATQNPIELEGTYPLPEAQLDRFMFETVIDYLPEEDEVEVTRATTSVPADAIVPVVSREEILAFQRVVRRVPVADAVVRYAVRLVRLTRPTTEGAPDFVKQWLQYGASVRAAQSLVLGGKARALLQGRTHVTFDDIRALAKPVFRHRLLRNFQAQSERITTDSLVEKLLDLVPLPKSGL